MAKVNKSKLQLDSTIRTYLWCPYRDYGINARIEVYEGSSGLRKSVVLYHNTEVGGVRLTSPKEIRNYSKALSDFLEGLATEMEDARKKK